VELICLARKRDEFMTSRHHKSDQGDKYAIKISMSMRHTARNRERGGERESWNKTEMHGSRVLSRVFDYIWLRTHESWLRVQISRL